MLTAEERSRRFKAYMNKLGKYNEDDFVCFRCKCRINNCNMDDRITMRRILRIQVKDVGIRSIHSHCLPLLQKEQPYLCKGIREVKGGI